MISIESYVRQGKSVLSRWALEPAVKQYARAAAYALGGFVFSAASLEHGALPLSMGFVWACRGWSAVLAALGGALGYWVFWGSAALQCIAWLALSLPAVLLLGNHRLSREYPLLFPACAMLVVAGAGLGFQLLMRDDTPILLYLLRVGLGGGSTWVFYQVLHMKNPIHRWLGIGLLIFSLAQILPVSWLGLGFLAAGAVTVAGAFPGAAVAGLALDLARVTAVPMTAVTVVGALVRLLPRHNAWLNRLAPAVLAVIFMRFSGVWDLRILPGLLLGGILGTFLPGPGQVTRRTGETGAAQVRLELAAGVLTQTHQLLSQAEEMPVDENALIVSAATRACSGCPCKAGCEDAVHIPCLPGSLLYAPLENVLELPILCRKSARVLEELHRSQEKLRAIRANRKHQEEYREAVIQQYRFLGQYLQSLSDGLNRRSTDAAQRYSVTAKVYGNRPEDTNADRCLRFPGPGGNYFVLLCDGMGSGPEALQESRKAGNLLKQLLSAGFPPEHALRSLNSLCVLRDRPGAVTMDLAQIRLDTGKTVLYKWGAAPSYLVTTLGAQRIGASGPPPGLSVSHTQEKTYCLTLRDGQVLLLVSDGIPQEEALRICSEFAGLSPEEMGPTLLQHCRNLGEDDATVVTINLKRA